MRHVLLFISVGSMLTLRGNASLANFPLDVTVMTRNANIPEGRATLAYVVSSWVSSPFWSLFFLLRTQCIFRHLFQKYPDAIWFVRPLQCSKHSWMRSWDDSHNSLLFLHHHFGTQQHYFCLTSLTQTTIISYRDGSGVGTRSRRSENAASAHSSSIHLDFVFKGTSYTLDLGESTL